MLVLKRYHDQSVVIRDRDGNEMLIRVRFVLEGSRVAATLGFDDPEHHFLIDRGEVPRRKGSDQ